MAFVQADIDTLKKAVASGVQSVRFADGRRVDYRTISELMVALAAAQAEVAAANGTPTSSVISYSGD